LIKTIFKNFPNIYTYLGTNLRYIPVVISKSAHPTAQPRGRKRKLPACQASFQETEFTILLAENGTYQPV
jgi:hypothetical protein